LKPGDVGYPLSTGTAYDDDDDDNDNDNEKIDSKYGQKQVED
jgi:hypothetical protein